MAEGNIREAVSPPRGIAVRIARAILYRLKRKKQVYTWKEKQLPMSKTQGQNRSALSPVERERVNQEVAAERKLREKFEEQQQKKGEQDKERIEREHQETALKIRKERILLSKIRSREIQLAEERARTGGY